MRPLRLVATVAALVTVTLGLGEAAADAQTLPSVDVRTWRPSTDPHASLVLEPIVSPGPWAWNVGAWLRYDHRPITLRSADTDAIAYRPVEHLLGLDLTASLGIGSRAAIGLSVPLVLFQDGSDGLPATVSSTSSVPSQALGDVGLHGKATVVANDDGGFGFALRADALLPTGDRSSFAGDGAVRVAGRAVAEYSLIVASIQGSLGYGVRTEERTWPDASVGGVRFGAEIPWTAGLTVRPQVLRLLGVNVDPGDRQTWEIAAHGSLPGGPVGPFGSGDPGSSALSPVMLAASDRVALGHYKDAFVLAGVDVGLSNAVGVPAIRGVLAVGWAPREHDKDADGVADDVDKCPEIPEDKDGFEDQDGCPEIDDDDDGVIDREDACPRVAGPASSDPKKNGCPQADADGDGVPDDEDTCPHEKGFRNDEAKFNGCPIGDKDGDGVPDAIDKCPDQPEDRDGFQDADGCPDPDDDGDGVADKDDACPKEAGVASSDPKRAGCPTPDRDGDAIDDAVDQCPDVAEVYNGVSDDDGCPDEGGKPIVTIDPNDPRHVVKLASPIKVTGDDTTAGGPKPDAATAVTLRALVLELNRHTGWVLGVATRPAPGPTEAPAQKAPLARTLAIVAAVNALAHRDGAAETVEWDAVRTQPGAQASGVGLVVLTPETK